MHRMRRATPLWTGGLPRSSAQIDRHQSLRPTFQTTQLPTRTLDPIISKAALTEMRTVHRQGKLPVKPRA